MLIYDVTSQSGSRKTAKNARKLVKEKRTAPQPRKERKK